MFQFLCPTHNALERFLMSDTFHVVPQETHGDLVRAAYLHRGFDNEEASAAAEFSAYATKHGIRTHNALKALHLDELFGSAVGGCSPGAAIEIKEKRFDACQTCNANKKLGQAVAYAAMDACIEMADKHGSGGGCYWVPWEVVCFFLK